MNLGAIEQTSIGSLDRLSKIADAVERLISPDPLRKDFLGQQGWVSTLFQAVKPDPAVLEFASRVACLATIADTIKARTGRGPIDVSGIMYDLNALLDRSIAADGFVINEANGEYGRIDLSKIDFEALAARFGTSKSKNIDLEQLKAAIRAQLDKLVRANRTRADYLAKFEELIESYNAGSRNIDELLKELLVLSRSLTDEQERHVRENLSQEELVVFDILTRPAPALSAEERAELKRIAKVLLLKLKDLLVLNWRQTVTARSRVQLAIEDLLDQGLPRAYTPELYRQKCDAVFEHVYERYGDHGASLSPY